LPGRVSDQSGSIANQKNNLVSEILEVAHLAKKYGVAQMNVRGCGIETGFDDEGFIGFDGALELLLQLVELNYLDGAALYQL
jgi:hypothetical protein